MTERTSDGLAPIDPAYDSLYRDSIQAGAVPLQVEAGDAATHLPDVMAVSPVAPQEVSQGGHTYPHEGDVIVARSAVPEIQAANHDLAISDAESSAQTIELPAVLAHGDDDAGQPNWTSEDLRRKLKLQVVDVSSGIKSNARDYARSEVNKKIEGAPVEVENMGRVDRLKHLARKAGRQIWYGNIGRDYVTLDETAKAREKIMESGNLYVNSGAGKTEHEIVMESVVNRFVGSAVNAEYEDVFLHKAAGEKQQHASEAKYGAELQDELRKVVIGKVSEIHERGGEFTPEDEKALSDAAQELLQFYGSALREEFGKDYSDKGLLWGHNVVEVAKEAKGLVDQLSVAGDWRDGLKRVEEAMDLSVGEAAMGARTEVRMRAAEKLADWAATRNKGTALLGNETVVAAVIATSVLGAATLGKRVITKGVGFVPLAGAAAVGVWAGARAKRQTKIDIENDAREREMGIAPDGVGVPHNKKREAVAKVNEKLNLKGAGELMQAIREGVDRVGEDPANLQVLAKAVAEARLRRDLSDQDPDKEGFEGPESQRGRLTYIAFDDIPGFENLSGSARVDAGREPLDDMIVAGDMRLRSSGVSDAEVDKMIDEAKKAVFAELSGSLTEREKLSKKLEWSEAVKTGMVAASVSAAFGGVLSEGHAALSSNVQGVFESRGEGQKVQTQLASIRDSLFGGATPGQTSPIAEEVRGGYKTTKIGDDLKFEVPQDIKVREKDGELSFYRVDSEGRQHQVGESFNPGASLTEAELRQHLGENARVSVSHNTELGDRSGPTKVDKYIESNREDFARIKREFEYDYGTDAPAFERNEQGLGMGGINGTGIDKNGNYVMSVRSMFGDESVQGNHRVTVEELLKKGRLGLQLSVDKDHQNDVVMLKFKENGTVVIDKDSLAGQLFEKENGRAKFNGAFAEAVEIVKKDADGSTIVRPLATEVGGNTVEELSSPKTNMTTARVDISAPVAAQAPALGDLESVPVIPVPLYGRGGIGGSQNRPASKAVSPESEPPIKTSRETTEPGGELVLPDRQTQPVSVGEEGGEVIRPDRSARRFTDEVSEPISMSAVSPKYVIKMERIYPPRRTPSIGVGSAPALASRRVQAELSSLPQGSASDVPAIEPARSRAVEPVAERMNSSAEVAKYDHQMALVFGSILGTAGQLVQQATGQQNGGSNTAALIAIMDLIGLKQGAGFSVASDGTVQIVDWRHVQMDKLKQLHDRVARAELGRLVGQGNDGARSFYDWLIAQAQSRKILKGDDETSPLAIEPPKS